MPDGTYLLFNFYTLTLIELKSAESKIAEEILKNPDKTHDNKKITGLKKLLIEKGFIIDDSINELDLLKKFHCASLLQKKNLGLTIVPTLACNFRCTYCYETGIAQTMSKEVELALLQFVKKNIQREGSLSVTWFGGEPLLRMDAIERLSKEFIKTCDNYEVSYSASMITNGYHLNKENVERLQKLKVKSAQVTLDGPPAIHDKRRPLKNGGNTFKKILNNIKEASERISIRLRMNVDEKNRGSIDDMLDILLREKMEKQVGFYLGQTYPYTSACGDIAGSCLSDEDFSLLGLETLMKMVNLCFTSVFNMPSKKDQFCLADGKNAFVITPSGRIVNCWNDVDNPASETGHLLKPATQKMKKNRERWWLRNPFELECSQCLLLPICMGGCPYIYLRTGKLNCHKWKHHLEESIAFYWFLKKIKKEAEIIREFQKTVELVKELKEDISRGDTL